jgi:lipopolysaccharide/colanic/teichoic acid biosynthesis glycosyltransferase
MSDVTAFLLFSLCGLVAIAPWTLFPLGLLCFRPRRPQRASLPRSLSVLIPAHNEAARIEGRIADARALREQLDVPVEIIVASDGSTDDTAVRARAIGGDDVVVLEDRTRRGKATTLNRLAAAATGEALLFSDASSTLSARTVAALIDALGDDGVGAASPRYVVDEQHLAWSVDARLRSMASRRDVLTGGSGAALLVRREAWSPLAADTINDDYEIALRLASSGRSLRHVGHVVVVDTPTRRLRTTFERHARITAGNLQTFARAGALLARPRIAVPLWLHKLPKALLPWLLLAMAAIVVVKAPVTAVIGLALVVGAVGVVGRPAVVGLVGLAGVLVGTLRALRGPVDVRWRRPDDEVAPALAPVPVAVRAGKRTLDLVGAAVGLVVAGPVIVVLAVLVKLDSRGPAFFGQERVRCTTRGAPTTFTMWKLRTMRIDAEAGSGPVWATVDDPRVTRMGRFLRRSRLDELPQLWNVLWGEMSLVGPRPERPRFVEWLEREIPGYSERVRRVRPGITGWAQVHCPYDASVDDVRQKVLYDLAYVLHLYRFSTFLKIELQTVFATVAVMVGGRGAR